MADAEIKSVTKVVETREERYQLTLTRPEALALVALAGFVGGHGPREDACAALEALGGLMGLDYNLAADELDYNLQGGVSFVQRLGF